VRQGIAPPASL